MTIAIVGCVAGIGVVGWLAATSEPVKELPNGTLSTTCINHDVCVKNLDKACGGLYDVVEKKTNTTPSTIYIKSGNILIPTTISVTMTTYYARCK